MRDAEADDDFYMGLALMSASGSRTDRCVLSVDDSDRIQIFLADRTEPSPPRTPHFAAFQSTPRKSVKWVYMTYLPSPEAVGDVISMGASRLVYLGSSELLAEAGMLFSSSMEIVDYRGNLHWLRDRIFCLRSKDIF